MIEFFPLEELLISAKECNPTAVGREEKRARRSGSQNSSSQSFEPRCHVGFGISLLMRPWLLFFQHFLC